MKNLFLLLLLLPINSFAQVAEPTLVSLWTYGGEGPDNVLTPVTHTADGGYIFSIQTLSKTGKIVDTFCNNYTRRTIFAKYNADCSYLEWSKCYLASIDDSFFSFMYLTDDLGYVLGGQNFRIGTFRIHKENASNAVIWSKSYGGSGTQILEGMIATNDGGYIMFGSAYSDDGDVGFHYGTSERDMWALKLDSVGDKVWSKVIGGTGDDIAASITVAPGGGCYIIGTTYSVDYDCTDNHGSCDIYIARLDEAGNIIWHKTIGGSGDEAASYAVADGHGGLVLVGASNSPDGDRTDFPSFGCPVWAMQIDSNGNIMWDKCYGGGGGNCYANSICKATDGSIWIAGVSTRAGNLVNNSYGRDDAWFVHADSVGNFLNSKVFGSSQDDNAYMVFPLANGNVIAGGYYGEGDGTFPLPFYGGIIDAFLTILSPLDQTAVSTTNIKGVNIFPNPATTVTTIAVADGGQYDITINDITGRRMYHGQSTGKKEIDVTAWASGFYTVQIAGDEGTKSIHKLIVQ